MDPHDSPPSPSPPPRHRVVAAWLVAGWLIAGGVAGTRLHLRGGVFGEEIPLVDSVLASLANALPWALAAGVAWIAAGRWPLRRGELLPPLTTHLAVGLVVVVGQQVLVALLRSTLIPGEFAPVDPWGQLPLDLVRWGPPALAVYGVLLGVSLWIRAPAGSSRAEGGVTSDQTPG